MVIVSLIPKVSLVKMIPNMMMIMELHHGFIVDFIVIVPKFLHGKSRCLLELLMLIKLNLVQVLEVA